MERARPVIFYRKDCPKCQKALDYLQTRGVGVDAVEVGSDEASLHRLERATGQTKTPTLIHDGENIHNFSIAELAAFLDKYHLDRSYGRA